MADATSALGELSAQLRVIVSDIMLPDHSGLDLLRHVTQQRSGLPMVLVTGMPKPGQRNRCGSARRIPLSGQAYLERSADRLYRAGAAHETGRAAREEALTKTHGFGASGDAEPIARVRARPGTTQIAISRSRAGLIAASTATRRWCAQTSHRWLCPRRY